MATVNFITAANMDDLSVGDGHITSTSSTLIRIENSPIDATLRQDYSGIFQLNGTGGVIGGTVTGFSEFSRASSVATYNQTVGVTGLNVDVIQAAAVLGRADVAAWYAFLYGGADTFNGSTGADIIHTYAGNDVITGGGNNDSLDGGTGIDTAVYGSARGAYTIARNANGSYGVSGGTEGADTLTAVERLQFAGSKVALDLTTGQAANNTVKMIGALFGATEITAHPEYVTVGLQLFDAGMTMQQVAQLALGTPAWLTEAGNLSNTNFVNTVYTNVVGAAPSASEAATYVNMLNSGATTQADLLVFAANHAVNEAHINLVGLQASGVVYA